MHVEKIIRLAKRLVWSPYTTMPYRLRVELRAAITDYERSKTTPKAALLLLADDDEERFSSTADVPRCAYAKCGQPMMTFRHGRRKYHSEACRKAAFVERRKRRT